MLVCKSSIPTGRSIMRCDIINVMSMVSVEIVDGRTDLPSSCIDYSCHDQLSKTLFDSIPTTIQSTRLNNPDDKPIYYD
jgi:hypothetical protein